MSSKRKRLNTPNNKSSHEENKYYKPFVVYSIVLLIGIFVPQYLGICYSEYTFVYAIIIPLCVLLGLYFRCIRKWKNGKFYLSLYASFSITFSLYNVINAIYIQQQDVCYFETAVDKAVSDGYRSPSFLHFSIDGNSIALPIRNEHPIKTRLENGETVHISGEYKKGLFSSMMIVSYSTH